MSGFLIINSRKKNFSSSHHSHFSPLTEKIYGALDQSSTLLKSSSFWINTALLLKRATDPHCTHGAGAHLMRRKVLSGKEDYLKCATKLD